MAGARIPCTGETAGDAPDGRGGPDRAVRAAPRIKYVHFWGHRPGPDGRLGVSCLSQWWPSAVHRGRAWRYATAEHWMMAGKARLFGDAEAERRSLGAPAPRTGQEGRAAGPRLRRGAWERERFRIVVEGSVHKFAAQPRCGRICCARASGCWWRRARWTAIWGIGLAADDERATDPARWRGENLLGFALMAAREQAAGGKPAGVR